MQPEIFVSTLHDEIAQERDLQEHRSGADFALTRKIFTTLFTHYMVEAGITSGPQTCSHDDVSEAGRFRLDGYALSADSEHLDLFVSLYKEGAEVKAIGHAEILAAVGEARRFLELCVSGSFARQLDESADVFALAQTIQLAFGSLIGIRICAITNGISACPPIPSFVLAGKDVLLEVIDANVLCASLQDSSLQDDYTRLAAFRDELLATVRAVAKLSGEPLLDAFVADTGGRLADAEEVPDFQRCSFAMNQGPMPAARVDGYAFDESDASLSLVIASFTGNDDVTAMSQVDLAHVASSIRSYAEMALGEVPAGLSANAENAGIGLAMDIASRRQDIARLRLYIVTDSIAHPGLVLDSPEIAGIPSELHVWDIARFCKAAESESGKDHFEVDFRLNGSEGLPALHARTACGEYEGYLCTIQGDVLAAIYEQYGGRLLEGNVRSFLSIKGKINSSIQLTIRERPAMFFAYNNGIAATADAVDYCMEGSLRIQRARNFQIVNGGQTTASLAAAARAGVDLSNIIVQMKLSVLPPQRAGELIPLIARFANSQNKVNESDFFANHPFHVRLEQLSRQVAMPDQDTAMPSTFWYYERARGQYVNDQKNLNKSEKGAFLKRNPKRQLLTKLDVAKLENTWKGLPHKVSNGGQKNFVFFAGWLAKAWSRDERAFDERYFRRLAAMSLLYQHTELLIARQSWYQGAYRPNITTYALALLQYMILQNGKGRQLDLNQIWQTQVIPAPLSDLIASLAKIALLILTDPARLKANVTEWAKSESCWERVRAAAPQLGADMLALLEDPATARARDADAAIDDKIGYGIFASTAVKGIEPQVWSELLRWGDERNVLNAMEIKLLRSATRLPRFAPSVPECEKIWSIRSKLIRNGFGQDGQANAES
jgi:hypothetical protein